MHTDVWARHAVSAHVIRHRRLSAAIARQFLRRLPSFVDRDDVYAAADLGLLCAATRFDASYGVPFGAYARLRIVGSVRDHLRVASVLPHRSRYGQHTELCPRVTVLSERHVDTLCDAGVSVEEICVSNERAQFVSVALSLLPPPLARVLPEDDTASPLRVLALRDGVSVATLSRRRMQAKTWLKTAVAFYDGVADVPCPAEVVRYLRHVTVRAGALRSA